jgi:nitrogen fixation-related uncharacterized protein
MKKKADETITWLQVNNLVPLFGTVIAVAGMYWGLKSGQDLMNQKLDQVSRKIDEHTIYSTSERKEMNQFAIDTKSDLARLQECAKQVCKN